MRQHVHTALYTPLAVTESVPVKTLAHPSSHDFHMIGSIDKRAVFFCLPLQARGGWGWRLDRASGPKVLWQHLISKMMISSTEVDLWCQDIAQTLLGVYFFLTFQVRA